MESSLLPLVSSFLFSSRDTWDLRKSSNSTQSHRAGIPMPCSQTQPSLKASPLILPDGSLEWPGFYGGGVSRRTTGSHTEVEVVFHSWCPWPRRSAGRRAGAAEPYSPMAPKPPDQLLYHGSLISPCWGAVAYSVSWKEKKSLAERKNHGGWPISLGFSKGRNSSLITWKTTNSEERGRRTRFHRKTRFPLSLELPLYGFGKSTHWLARSSQTGVICHWSAALLDFAFWTENSLRCPTEEWAWNKASC